MTYISNLKSDQSSSLELLDVKMNNGHEVDHSALSQRKIDFSTDAVDFNLHGSKGSLLDQEMFVVGPGIFSQTALSAIKESEHEQSAFVDSPEKKQSEKQVKTSSKVISYKKLHLAQKLSQGAQYLAKQKRSKSSGSRNSRNATEDNKIFIESQNKSDHTSSQKNIRKNNKNMKKIKSRSQARLQSLMKSEENT